MYSFTNDYSEGAHKNILQALIKTNFEQTDGYGVDKYCKQAEEIIKKLINNEKSNVHFLTGGTVTNAAFISSALRPHEGVIAASCAHINVHESGAIESRGHKVIVKEEVNGKILASDIEDEAKKHYLDEGKEHCVKPKMVYISNPTELGTIYTKAELEAIKEVCDKYGLYLYMDGARLGCALTCVDNDVTLEDLGRLTDAFYIGGTKLGALFGEALVINNEELNVDFRYHIKQNGGMIAKGRLMGVQFVELLKDGLYFEIAKHENRLANKLTLGIGNLKYGFYSMSATNQVFPILPNDILKVLSKKYSYEVWEKLSEEKTVIRLCTSFATTEKAVDSFLKDLAKLTLAKEKLLKELDEQNKDSEVIDYNQPVLQQEKDEQEGVFEEVKESEEAYGEGEDVIQEEQQMPLEEDVALTQEIEEENDYNVEDFEQQNAFENNDGEDTEESIVLPRQEEVMEDDFEQLNIQDIENQRENVFDEVDFLDDVQQKSQGKKSDFEAFIPMEEKAEEKKVQKAEKKDIFEDIFESGEDYTFVNNDKKEENDEKVMFQRDSDMDFFSEFEFED